MKVVVLRGLFLLLMGLSFSSSGWCKVLTDASFKISLIKQVPDGNGAPALTLYLKAQSEYVPIVGAVDIPLLRPAQWPSYVIGKQMQILPLEPEEALIKAQAVTQFDSLQPGVAAVQSQICSSVIDLTNYDAKGHADPYMNWCFGLEWAGTTSGTNTLIEYVPYLSADITGDGYKEIFVPALGVFITNFFGEKDSSAPPYVLSQYAEIQGISIPNFDSNGSRRNYNKYVLQDLNGDGFADLVILRSNNAPMVAYNEWGGNFSRLQIATQFLTSEYSGFSTTVAAVAGEFGVEDGVANYTIPIGVPVGTAGVTPKLAFSYSSGGGGGSMGTGWSLDGAESSITRCGLSYMDRVGEPGRASGLSYTNQDVLCLDGQPLSLVSGTYWTSGAVYAPRQDTVTKVVQWGAEGSGFFLVFEKSGDIRSYGNASYEGVTTNSKLCFNASGGAASCASGTLLREAALSSVQDKVGNYMVFVYDAEQLGNNVLALKNINYTGNSGKGLSPYNKVVVNYANRVDQGFHYANGALSIVNKLISSVRVYGEGDVLYREYKLFYINDNLTGATQLVGMTECVAGNVCAKPTLFAWSSSIEFDQLRSDGFVKVTDYFSDAVLNEDFDTATLQYPDVNGDGRADVCGRQHDGIRCVLSGPSGLSGGQVVASTICRDGGNGADSKCNDIMYYKSIRFLDMNGDGLDDIVWQGYAGFGVSYTKLVSGAIVLGAANELSAFPGIGGNMPIVVYTGTSTSTSTSTTTTQLFSSRKKFFGFADTDGDSLPKLCIHYPSEGIKCFERAAIPSATPGAPFVYSNGWKQSTYVACNLYDTGVNGTCDSNENFSTINYPDVDGDGKSDLVYRSDQGMRVWKSAKTLFYSSGLCADKSDCDGGIGYQYPDMNGDGLPEFCYQTDDGGTLRCHINTGKGWDIAAAPLLVGSRVNNFYTGKESGVTFGDLNDDGLDDLVVTNKDSIRMFINLGQNNQASFAFEELPEIRDVALNGTNNWQTFSIVDIDGDGVKELTYRRDEGVYAMRLKAKELPNYLKSIQTGFGLRTNIKYSNLLDTSVYSPSAPDQFPVSQVRGQFTVVKSVSSTGSSGPSQTINYFYKGLRHHLTGAGLLGFEQVTASRDYLNRQPVGDSQPVNETVTTTFSTDWYSHQAGLPLLTTKRINGVLVMSTRNAYKTDYINKQHSLVNMPTSWGSFRDGIRYSVHPSSIETKTYEPGSGALVLTERQEHVYESFGNLKSSTHTVSGGGASYRTVTNNEYGLENADNWYLGKLTKSIVTKSGTDRNGNAVPVRTKTSAWEYDAATGAVTIEKTLGDDGVAQVELRHQIETSYNGSTYKDYGIRNVVRSDSVASLGSAASDRIVKSFYDEKGRFPVLTVDALGFETSATYDKVKGVKTSETDINGFVNRWEYDSSGRLKKHTAPNGVVTTTSIVECLANCPSGAIYYVETKESSESAVVPLSGFSRSYFDKFGREFYQTTINPNGKEVAVLKTFDSEGRVAKVSEPYFVSSGDPTSFVETFYDVSGRVVRVNNPDGSKSEIIYSGLKTEYVNEIDKRRIEQEEPNGLLWRSEDHAGNYVVYSYDADGNNLETRTHTGDAADYIVTIIYDSFGRKKEMIDPSKGRWTYDYNERGELVLQTDANGARICNVYDIAGRLIARVDGYGSASVSSAKSNCAGGTPTARWVYDTSPRGSGAVWKGKLHKVLDESKGYEKSYTYTQSYGLPEVETEIIDGFIYTSENTYDARGRLLTATYPSRYAGVSGKTRLTLKNVYNEFGALQQIQDVSVRGTAASPSAVWTAGEVNARGQMEKEVYGVGFITAARSYDALTAELSDTRYSVYLRGEVHHEHYDFDAIGNLTLRQVTAADPNKLGASLVDWQESFEYDDLNRLNKVTFTDYRAPSNNATQTPSYLQNGNVVSLNTSDKSPLTYRYEIAGKPHAVSSIADGSQIGKTFQYDAVGNMLSSTGLDGSGGRKIIWNAANYPTRMEKGSNYVEIVYGPNRERLKRTDKSGSETTVTTYVGGGYEYVRKSDGNVEEKLYVAGIGMLTIKNGDADAPDATYRYFFKDHLGSIVGVINSAFTANGLEVDRMAYDPWGKRRKYMDVSYNSAPALAVIKMPDNEIFSLGTLLSPLKTTRGFTGHEMLDTVGLVHMNGRVYDPELGRFVSADPVVQDATDVQSFNRYAYVRNNPVSLTDPSGFSWFSKAWKKYRHALVKYYVGDRAIFKKVGRELARNPALATVARIVACVGPWAVATCVPVNAYIGAATAYAVSGSWSLAFKAGIISGYVAFFSAAINGGAGFEGVSNFWARSLADAALSGVSGAVSGGKFMTGFRSGLISSAISGAYAGSPLSKVTDEAGNVLIAAALGGTTSALTGGKFANGAMTGAFQAIASMAASEKGAAAAGESKSCGTCPCPNSGSPIEFGSGRKWLEITDSHVGRLELKRHYNSFAHGGSVLGGVWRHDFERRLDIKSFEITYVKADGRISTFKSEGEHWESATDRESSLVSLEDGSWLLTTEDNTQETYDATGHLQRARYLGGYTQILQYNDNGQLVSVTDSDDRALTFKYRTDGKLYSVVTSAGVETVYRYNRHGMLAGVVQPDATPDTLEDNARLAYLYEDARFPQALTGYIDEAGVRYGKWQYDEQMRGNFEHTEGLNSNAFVYNEDGSTTVTNALGRSTTYHFNSGGKVTSIEGEPTDSCLGSNNAYEYDANGFIAAKTDWNGIRTEYVHDARGRELRRTEAVGRPEQYTVETTWHDQWKLPVRIDAPGLTTEYDYDDTGLLLAKREIDTTQPQPEGFWAKLTQTPAAREWRYSYNEQGLVTAVDGPRTDVNDITRYAYDAQGNQTVIENALGHTMQVLAHNDAGLPETLRDPNGTQTALEYNAHGWLTAKTVTTAAGETARTEYAYSPIVQYDGTGLLSQVTSPTGAVLTYGYNADRKLSSVSNAQGERIDYTLDAMGNVTAQTVVSAQGEIVRQHAQAFDELSRLIGEISAEGHRTTHHYDKNGNRVETIDALGRATRVAYDGLNRVISVTDALGGVTRTDYTARGEIAQVVDARGITTRYERNGYGEVIKQISQDTGVTTFAYDAAGNLTKRTDARGVITQYRYDALNRLLAVHYPADAALDVAYHYDNASTLGVGRLDRISDQTGQRRQAYDGRGNVVAETQVIGEARYDLGYGYNTADQLVSETYPSGHVLALERNAEGQVIAMSLNKGENRRAILGEVAHQAFGGIESLRWGDGLEEQRAWTQDGRLALLGIEGLSHKDYTYDAVGNLVSITDRLQAANDRDYGYDELDRLVSSRTGTDGVELFAYDAVGNRKTYERVEDGKSVVAEAYRYDTQSNRLLEVTRGAQARVLGYDAVGNTVKDQGFDGKARVLDYGVDNRLKSVDNGVTYWHNAEGQRVIARGDKGLKHFVYDVQDRLVAEADAGGEVIREYFYLDRVPVAMLDVANDQLFFVHGDHLGTPKLVTDAVGNVVWSGEALAFGGTKVSGAVGLDFRFPGQVEDGATGYFYNYFRDYDSTVGRYLQSDPIGLKAGVNTYGYVRGRPITSSDIFGLADACPNNPAIEISERALSDNRLTLSEANEIWRANTDPNFSITIDASELLVQKTSMWSANNTASGTVVGTSWLVHGSVTLYLDPNSSAIGILPGKYNFEMHNPSNYQNPLKGYARNAATFAGFYLGSNGGFSTTTDYTIKYSGSPRMYYGK